jgi:chaperone required for assembly of F1-ATPase
MAAPAKRFYQDVSVGERGDGFDIRLDGCEVKTPARASLTLPRRELAEAIAGEWRAQEAKIRIETMPLTRLAYTAIDRVSPNREAVIDGLLVYGENDLLCYRATGPDDLVRRQAELWDPPLRWAREHLGASLYVGEGIAHVRQPETAQPAFRNVLSGVDNFRLAGLLSAVSLLGSLVLALALEEGVIGAEVAWAAARLDENYQAERWGEDPEALARAAAGAEALRGVARFLSLVATRGVRII